LSWGEAVARLAHGKLLPERLGVEFVRVLTTVKRGEMQRYQAAFHPLEYAWGLERA
jgi:glutamine synthetase